MRIRWSIAAVARSARASKRRPLGVRLDEPVSAISLAPRSGDKTVGLERVEDPHKVAGVHAELAGERALQAVIAADEEFLGPLDDRQRNTVAATLQLLLLPHEEGSSEAEAI